MIDELLAEAERRHALQLADGVQLLAASALVRRPFDPGLPLVLVPTGEAPVPTEQAEAFQSDTLPGRDAHATDPLELLRSLYGGFHPALSLGQAPDATLATLTTDELAGRPWLVPALVGAENAASPHGLPWLVARLRAPDGCPWDREQTHLSLRKFLLEESYEVYDALERGATPQLAEELGDLLLQIVLHAHYASEEGVFDLSDVYRSVVTKIVRRHPHVFGDVEARSVDQVVRNWEQIKAQERADTTVAEQQPGMAAAFAGLSRSLPALAYAQEMQERAASLGYDWPDVVGIADKIAEETAELTAATDATARAEEFGDLLLVLTNLGRRLGVDAEAALRAASAKFAARFAHVERLAAERGVVLRDLSPAALDELWHDAKAATGRAAPVGAR